jgi:hypothetical protein
MSMSDNIKRGVSKKRSDFNSESEVREFFNNAASKTLRKFLQRVDAGEIAMDNFADLQRLFIMYKEINGITEAMEGKAGQSMLPEVNLKQDKVLSDQVDNGKLTEDEEGRLDVETMSMEDVADLLRDMDIAQNKTNEGTF